MPSINENKIDEKRYAEITAIANIYSSLINHIQHIKSSLYRLSDQGTLMIVENYTLKNPSDIRILSRVHDELCQSLSNVLSEQITFEEMSLANIVHENKISKSPDLMDLLDFASDNLNEIKFLAEHLASTRSHFLKYITDLDDTSPLNDMVAMLSSVIEHLVIAKSHLNKYVTMYEGEVSDAKS